MKKIGSILSICIVLLFMSCEKDDVTKNSPPTQVKNIKATVISGTTVRIDWDPSTDSNNDDIFYDVMVNQINMGTGQSNNTITFDATQFIAKSLNQVELNKKLAKGINVDLEIIVTAFDDQDEAAEPKEINTTVFINTAPSNFSFKEISFDVDNYDWIEITWNPSTDLDGDTIRYDIFLNDLLIEENYSIDNNVSTFGYFYYEQNFESYLNQEFNIRVIAKDELDSRTEISRSFNFRGSDKDLGGLTLPFQEFFDIEILKEEIDHKIGYRFSVAEETGYSISLDQNNVEMYLSDQNGNLIGSGHYIADINLQSGNYYLELVSNTSNADIQDSLSLSLRDAESTDVDLGLFEVPYQGQHDIEVSYDEPDQEVNYSFETDKMALFSIRTNVDATFYLSNNNKVMMQGDLRRANEILIPPGNYTLRIENNSYQTTISGPLNIYLNEDRITDIYLGELVLPFNQTFSFSIDENEPDQKVGYKFTLNDQVGYAIIPSRTDVNLILKNSNNEIVNSGNFIKGTALDQGDYYLEMQSTSGQYISGVFNMVFRDPKLTDQDFGSIIPPIGGYIPFAIQYNEPDNKIGYAFTLELSSGIYVESMEENVRFTLYDSSGTILATETTFILLPSIPAGNYYLELKNENFDTLYGEYIIEFDDYSDGTRTPKSSYKDYDLKLVQE